MINFLNFTKNDILINYIEEFKKDKMELNEYRDKIISITFLVLNIVLLFADLTIFIDKWNILKGYKELFYGHVVLFIGLSIHLIFLKLKNKNNYRLSYILHIYFLLLGLLWSAIISVNAQHLHGQISAFIISIFALAAVIILDYKESLLLYGISSCVFYVFMYKVDITSQQFTGIVINTSFILIIAFVISMVNYKNYVSNFINRKIIDEKNILLDNSRKNLEDLVELRTKELVKANQKIIDEIEKSHEMEIEIVKTKSLYEEKNKLLEETMKYEKLRSNFFSNISHELRTPLNLIYSTQQLVELHLYDKNEDLDREKIISNCDLIKQNTYRLVIIINNIIDLTKMDSGNFKVKIKNGNIVKIVEDVTLSVAEFVEIKNRKLIFDTDVEEKIIACDPEKIERVILNLISNAIKFTKENGSILVKVHIEENKVLISIKDDGIGIPKNMRDLIFQKFMQVDESINRSNEGSGIGLSLVKSLIEMQDGKISIKSEDGKGSEFIIELKDYCLPDNEIEHEKNITYDHETISDRVKVEFSDIYI